MTETTLDKLLGGRFEIEQPAQGYRIAVDTLLLAASIPVHAGETVLDMGCGVGGVMLALASRVQDCAITGIEIQPAMAALAASNIHRNGFDKRLEAAEGDAMKPREAWLGAFDHAALNPPFHQIDRHTAPPDAGKARANMDEKGELEGWIVAASSVLKEGGTLSLIHRADRQEEILQLCATHFGAVFLKPVLPREGGLCKRILVRARKGGPSELAICAPFLLYGPDGHYSAQAEGLLRHAEAMDFLN